MGNCAFEPVPLQEIGDYEFNPNDQIGHGQHGKLYQGNTVGNQAYQVAIKELKGQFTNEQRQKAEPLIEKMKLVKHPNVAKYVDHYFDMENRLYLISDYIDYANFHDILHGAHTSAPIEELDERIRYSYELVSGIVGIHDTGLTHGHLRAHNIMIGRSEQLKICDFALNELIGINTDKFDRKISLYNPPECNIVGSEPITIQGDIWALGVLLYEIMYQKRPVEVVSGSHQIYDNLHWGSCAELDDLIKKCMVIDPKQRIQSKDIKNHPFMKKYSEKFHDI